MPLTHSFTVGRFRCHTLEAGLQRLDGGAMFGVVPKPLWQQRMAPDDRNRIPLAMRCLLVEHPDGLVLIDTGLGNKEDARFREIYGTENDGDPGPTRLEDALAEVGVRPDQVRWVINTHLHFDHAGGNTVRRPDGGVELTFPNATYVVQRHELDYAGHTNERTRASYLPPNFAPIAAAARWHLVDGNVAILEGIHGRLTPGHVPWHQSILIESAGEGLLFLGDVMPTAAHFPLPWIMGYDVEPLRTLESKRQLVKDALAHGWRLAFEHDPEVLLARVVPGGKGPELGEVFRRQP